MTTYTTVQVPSTQENGYKGSEMVKAQWSGLMVLLIMEVGKTIMLKARESSFIR